MPQIAIKDVITFTSQDAKHPVSDLVSGRGSWLGHPGDRSTRLQADFLLHKATKITHIDIGNAGSELVGVEVGRSAWPCDRPLVALLPPVSLQTREDLNNGRNRNTVRMFKSEDLMKDAREQLWDRVRVVCLQPFPNRSRQYGLSMLKLYTVQERLSHTQANALSDFSLEVTSDKREELMSRMNLPALKAKTISKRIGVLESSRNPEVHKDSRSMHTVNSPLSRAAQLVTLAAKPPTKKDADAKRIALERESLHYLMSLNLTAADIDTIHVKEVRQNFEKKRKKELDLNERRIFKDITLDYAQRRIEVLEKEDAAARLGSRGIKTIEVQKNTVNKRKREDDNPEARNTNSTHVNGERFLQTNNKSPKHQNKEAQSSELEHKHQERGESSPCSGRSFTFGGSRSLDKPSGSLKQGAKSPAILSKERAKLRQEDDLSSPLRNSVALADAKVAIPNKPKWLKKITAKQEASKQSDLGGWISRPMNKKPKDRPFSFSSRAGQDFDSNVCDLVSSIRDDEPEPSFSFSSISNKGTTKGVSQFSRSQGKTRDSLHNSEERTSSPSAWITRKSPMDTKGGYRLGTTPDDKFTSSARREVQETSSTNQTLMVECPLCSEFRPSAAIEAHAAVCGLPAAHDSDSNSSSISLLSDMRQKSSEDEDEEKMVQCPVCRMFIEGDELERHATDCAASMFD